MILSVSHIDLDGIGCQIVLNKFYKNTTNMNINYDKIDEYFYIIDDFIYNHKTEIVYITDLSFSILQLEKLNDLAIKHFDVNFYFIDHHPYEDYSHILRPNNLKIFISNKASATLLTYKFISHKFKIKYKELEEFISYINAYDIWLQNKKEFKGGLVFNETFWHLKLKQFYFRYKDNFKLRNSDKEYYKEMLLKKTNYWIKAEKQGKIFKQKNRIFMVIGEDYQSYIQLDFPNYKAYIILTSYGKTSIRFVGDEFTDGILTKKIIKEMEKHPLISNIGGHNKAFAMSLKENSSSNQANIAKYILNLIDKKLEEIGI